MDVDESFKICKDCNIKKSLNNFYKRLDNDCYRGRCFDCQKIWCNKNYKKKYKTKIPKAKAKLSEEEINKRKRKYMIDYNNRPEVKLRQKEYRKNNREKINKKNRDWRSRNKDKDKIIQRKKLDKKKKNINYKMRIFMSGRISKYLKNKDRSKNGESILKYLNFSLSDLKQHLESQFEPWMTWENYGKYSPKTWLDKDVSTWIWQIDHIIPHSEFNYSSMEDDLFKKCWSLNNLRPLSSKQNVLDGAKKVRHSKKH